MPLCLSFCSNSRSHFAGRKSCAITTAKRLAQFLGDDRIKDKGLNCNYVVAKRPENSPTSERAVPVAIFSTEPSVARTFLRKWVGDLAQGGWQCGATSVSALRAHPLQMGEWHGSSWNLCFGRYLGSIAKVQGKRSAPKASCLQAGH